MSRTVSINKEGTQQQFPSRISRSNNNITLARRATLIRYAWSTEFARNQSTRIITLRSDSERSDTLSSAHLTRISTRGTRRSTKGFNDLNMRRIIERQFFFRVIISSAPELRVIIVQSLTSGDHRAPSPSRHDHRENHAMISDLVRPSFSPRDLSHSPKLDREKSTLRGNGGLPAACFLPTASGSSTYLAGVVIGDSTQARRNEQPSFPSSQRLHVRSEGWPSRNGEREGGWLNVHPSDRRHG